MGMKEPNTMSETVHTAILESLMEVGRMLGYRFERDPDGTVRVVRPDGTVAVIARQHWSQEHDQPN